MDMQLLIGQRLYLTKKNQVCFIYDINNLIVKLVGVSLNDNAGFGGYSFEFKESHNELVKQIKNGDIEIIEIGKPLT